MLSYGVEDVHYKKTSDGHITSVVPDREYVFRGAQWSKPNQALAYVWEGNPLTLWEDKEKYNKSSIQACDVGFNFDITPVATEYFTLEQIYFKYRDILENGLVDPDEGLAMLNRELHENGIDEVVREKQRQFDKWGKS